MQLKKLPQYGIEYICHGDLIHDNPGQLMTWLIRELRNDLTAGSGRGNEQEKTPELRIFMRVSIDHETPVPAGRSAVVFGGNVRARSCCIVFHREQSVSSAELTGLSAQLQAEYV